MATRTISTKLAVEGESQYKAAVASCNSELSTLKSSLALVESEYRNNANSMEALTAKGNALAGLYDAQKGKVETLEKALENAKSAQETYSDRVATAKDKVAEYEKALQNLEGSTGDTTQEQAALTAELDKWNSELQEAEAYQTAAEKGVNNWQTQLNKANVELNGLSDEIDKNNKYLDEAEKSADDCATSIDGFGKETKKSAEAIDTLGAALVAGGVAKAVKEIAAALMECAAASASFETAMAKLSTLADTSVVPMDSLKASLLALSNETGTAVESLAEAAYQALSAGVDTANVISFVSTATKLSQAGFTEASAAVDVMTTALNAYGLEGSEAERVASMLVKTQDLGKTSVDELASSMGRVIPTASAYNVNLENLSATYAVLTKNGQSTRIATTNLGAMMDELASTSSNVSKILNEETGKSFSDLMAEGSSLGDVINILAENVDGNSTAFSNLWGSTTAAKAALTLFNTGADEFNNVLGDMETSSGMVERNFQIMADTTEFAQQRMSTAAQNLQIAIGDQLNPALKNLYNFGADAFSWATDFVNEHPAVVSAITGVVVALSLLLAAFTAFTVIQKLIPVIKAFGVALNSSLGIAGLVATAVVGLAVAIGTFVSSLGSADAETKAFTKSLEESSEAYQELTAGMEYQQQITSATATALLSLLDVEEKSASQKEAIAQMVEELNEAIPELGLAYGYMADDINMSAEALERLVEKAAAQEEYETQVARLSELYSEQAEAAARLQEAEDALSEAKETGAGGTKKLQNNVDALRESYETLGGEISELEAASYEYGEHQAQITAQTNEMENRVDSLVTEIESLQEAYTASYQSAYSAISQQLGLFNELDGTAKTSIDNLIGSLQSQIDYMGTYAENIQKAMELGVDEGLVRKLSDGSEESAQILAAIVEGGEEDIALLNEKLAQVEEGKENFSDTVAQMETDFDEKMKDLVEDLNEAIKEMDVADDAYVIGTDNINGLINGAASKKTELVNTYTDMANAALAAYKAVMAQASPSKKMFEAGAFDFEGLILGAESKKQELSVTYGDMAQAALDAIGKAVPSEITDDVITSVPRKSSHLTGSTEDDSETSVSNNFNIAELVVRTDNDIKKIAKELYNMQKSKSRGKGVNVR